ncbi:MAG: hypothetical protein PUP91_13675 [Rhizonema sp. PD37]|nr:hypothetical protein [Rhizonema sp. PD37]
MPQVRRRRNQCQRDRDRTKLVTAYLEGRTLSEIGKKLGVSEAQCSRDLKKSKLNWRSVCDRQTSEEFSQEIARIRQKQVMNSLKLSAEHSPRVLGEMFGLFAEQQRLYQIYEQRKIQSLEDSLDKIQRAGWRCFVQHPGEIIAALERLQQLDILSDEKYFALLEAILGAQRLLRQQLKSIFELKEPLMNSQIIEKFLVENDIEFYQEKNNIYCCDIDAIGNSAKISLESDRAFVTVYNTNFEKIYASVAYSSEDLVEIWGEIQEQLLKINGNHN